MTTNSKIPNQQINAENVDNVTGKMTNSAMDGKSSGEWFIVCNFEKIIGFDWQMSRARTIRTWFVVI